MTREMIREWMTQNNHSRKWLADKCGVTSKTVNNWLSSDRGVPAKAIRIIEALVEFDQSGPVDSKPRLVLEFTRKEFDKINLAASRNKMTVSRWAELQLKKLSDLELEEAKRKLLGE